MLSEVNVDFVARLRWLHQLGDWLSQSPWIKAVIWSQAPSRGAHQVPGAGNLDWSALHDPPAAQALRLALHRRR